MIALEGVTVQFGAIRSLDGLSATITAPVAGLIGPNGAGKTTLLNVLSGFLTPRAGTLHLDGTGLIGLSPAARVRCGIRRTFQTEQIAEDLTAWDNVLALRDHVPVSGLSAREDVGRALAYTGLMSVADVPGSQLNLFERRMVEIAKALVGAPKLILMDEPGAGMTEIEAQRLRRVVLGIPAAFGAQVLLIDHDVDLISATCTETLVLDFGKRLALGPTQAVLDDPVVRDAYLGTL